MTPESSSEGPRTRKGIVEARTANEQFKESYARWFAGGLLFAVLAHFALFEFFPRFRAADIRTT